MRQLTFDDYLRVSGNPEPEQMSVEEILRGPSRYFPKFATKHHRCFIRWDGAVLWDDVLLRDFSPKDLLFWWCRGL